jgi:hypothetical protein
MEGPIFLSPRLMVPVGLARGAEEARIDVEVGTGVKVGAGCWAVAPGAPVAAGAATAAGAGVRRGVAVADEPQAAMKTRSRTEDRSTVALVWPRAGPQFGHPFKPVDRVMAGPVVAHGNDRYIM